MSEEDLENGIETNIIVFLDFYKPIKLIENTRSEVSSFEFAIDDFENIPEDVKAKAVFAHPRTTIMKRTKIFLKKWNGDTTVHRLFSKTVFIA